MNFDYSYRAFLITCLLFGILFLAFKSINLSKYEIVKEENFDMEYSHEDTLLEEELAVLSQIEAKVETNRAYNEAEKFISEIEKESAESRRNLNATYKSEIVSESLNSENSEIKNSKKSSDGEESSPSDTDTNIISIPGSSPKKNSTLSYSLLNRKALQLPNPVYTCATPGKIVINITVSDRGKIIHATYNKASSTTSNECLVYAALDYAKKAKFTTVIGKKEQIGSITYNFPGQR